VEDITEALWGTRVSSGTVSRLNQKIYAHIEAWRNRQIVGAFPYLYLDGVILKRSWAGEVRNVSVLVAIGIGSDGHRQILGVAEGEKEDFEGWQGFVRHLKDRGLSGMQLIISDACRGLVEAAAELFPDAQWQRCVVHFYRNVFSHVPNGKVAEVARMLKAIHAQEDRKAAHAKAAEVVSRLKEMKLRNAAELVEHKVEETLVYYAFPSTHWRQIRTNNPLERIIREIGRRTRVSRCISRRALGVDVGRGKTQTHRGDQVGQAALPRDGCVAFLGASYPAARHLRNVAQRHGRSM